MIKIINKIVELLADEGITVQKGSPDMDTLQLDEPIFVLTSEQVIASKDLCSVSMNESDIKIWCASPNTRDYDETYLSAMKIQEILFNATKSNPIQIDNELIQMFKFPMIKDLGTDTAGRFVIEVKARMLWQYLNL